MKYIKVFLISYFLNYSLMGNAQIVQTIRGKVMDSESKYPLFAAYVCLLKDSTQYKCMMTTEKGEYKIEGVDIGRYTLVVSYIGYKEHYQYINVEAGKEFIANISVEQDAFDMQTFEVEGVAKGAVKNEMALVSTKSFDVEESNRYAGSRGDPARMVANLAGVQGTDDSRNDIVIRGNSPMGVIYQLEGVAIPNPNHFAISGSGGGAISIINSKTLSNSDFYTGAFPAEIGNSISGAFDLNLRNGNNEKNEFTGQFGVLGAEFIAEGPLNKEKGSSYLVSGRYATFGLLTSLGLDIGTKSIPKYQDGTFKLNFPLADGGNIAVFGLGGSSKIDFEISKETDTSQVDLYANNNRNQYFRTYIGIVGASYSKPLNENSFFKSTLTISTESQRSDHDFFLRHINAEGNYVVDTLYDFLNYHFTQSKLSNATFINTKLNKKNVLKAGVNVDLYQLDYKDSIFDGFGEPWLQRYDYSGNTLFGRAYVQVKHKLSDKLVVIGGLHAQYFAASNSISPLEPRASFKWQLKDNQSLFGGVGLHSQLQPLYTYYYNQFDVNNVPVYHNRNMDFTKSRHYVMGYANNLKSNLNFKTEIYYQSLYNIPVDLRPSSYSLVNQGSGFDRFFPDTLINEGTGKNMGVELTVEKYFDKSYYLLFNGSVYDSKYTGSDGIERNTSYNNNFTVNFLLGKEWMVRKKNRLGLGTRVSYGGGKRYGIVDTAASNQIRELVYQDSLFNAFQFADYFRADIKWSYVINAKHVNHEISIDLLNIFDTRNILALTYAPNPNDPEESPIRRRFQLGFLPLFYYKISF